jgi:hypothetical protein
VTTEDEKLVIKREVVVRDGQKFTVGYDQYGNHLFTSSADWVGTSPEEVSQKVTALQDKIELVSTIVGAGIALGKYRKGGNKPNTTKRERFAEVFHKHLAGNHNLENIELAKLMYDDLWNGVPKVPIDVETISKYISTRFPKSKR